ncbi:MAG: BON domain-containing protein [Pseudomonadota bacterium]
MEKSRKATFVSGPVRPALWCAGFLLLGGLLAGCQKQVEPKTAGEQLDSLIDKSHQVAVKTAEQTREALHDIGQKVDEKAPQLKEQAREAGSSVQTAVDDMTVTARVSAGLARDADLSALKIDVGTKNGVVTLKGPAPSEAARLRAASIASGVAGVVSVDNQLVAKAG